MDIQKLVGFNGMIYDKENELFGSLAGVNFLNGTIIIAVETGEEDGEVVLVEDLKMEDVELLPLICSFDGNAIISRDILSIDDKLYEIELLEDNNITLHLLNNELERVLTGWSIPMELAEKELNRIKENKEVELVANFYEIGGVFEEEVEEEEYSFDFDIKIAKRGKDGYIEYLYACNDKKNEQIDLITVVFVGAEILDNAYERQTISYDEFEALLESGTLQEVGQGELRNYALGMLHGNTATNDVADDYEEDYEEEDYEEEEDCDCDHCTSLREDVCQDCNEYIEDCDCI